MSSVEECYRGHNVRVFRLNRAKTLSRLQECARRLVETCADVVEVRLFGSLAHGDAGPGSDADVFIVLRDGAPPFLERMAVVRHFEGAGIGCDVIAYTESERDAALKRGDRFIHTVMSNGFVLAGGP